MDKRSVIFTHLCEVLKVPSSNLKWNNINELKIRVPKLNEPKVLLNSLKSNSLIYKVSLGTEIIDIDYNEGRKPCIYIWFDFGTCIYVGNNCKYICYDMGKYMSKCVSLSGDYAEIKHYSCNEDKFLINEDFNDSTCRDLLKNTHEISDILIDLLFKFNGFDIKSAVIEDRKLRIICYAWRITQYPNGRRFETKLILDLDKLTDKEYLKSKFKNIWS